MTQSRFKELSEQSGVFNEKSLEFQNLIMERSGLGNDTSLPPGDRICLASLDDVHYNCNTSITCKNCRVDSQHAIDLHAIFHGTS